MVEGEKELRIRLEFVGWASRDIVMHSVRKDPFDFLTDLSDVERERD